jgi:YD repeat-containing protein
MARTVRIEYEGAVYHVMCRGDHGESVFPSEGDRETFLDTLAEACERTQKMWGQVMDDLFPELYRFRRALEDPRGFHGDYSTDPINVLTGNCLLDETDIVIPCPGLDIVFVRAYNSLNRFTEGPLGPKWTHSYHWFITDRANVSYKGSAVANWKVLHAGDGAMHWFRKTGDDQYDSPIEVNWRLTRTNDLYRVSMPGGIVMTFGDEGMLDSIAHPSGATLSLEYDFYPARTKLHWQFLARYAGSPARQLKRVVHSNGQYLEFEYDLFRLASVTTPSEHLTVEYSYDGLGQLTGRRRATSLGVYDTEYEYGSHHTLTRRVNDAGHGFRYEYVFETLPYGLTFPRGKRGQSEHIVIMDLTKRQWSG